MSHSCLYISKPNSRKVTKRPVVINQKKRKKMQIYRNHSIPRLTSIKTNNLDMKQNKITEIITKEQENIFNDENEVEMIKESEIGYLNLIIGPMFAGKTTAIIDKVKHHKSLDENVIAVKSDIDNRYAQTENYKSYIVSHSRNKIECFSVHELNTLKKLFLEDYEKAKVIVIDEAQFFPDLVEFCKIAVDKDNKTVYVAGLDGNYKREPFNEAISSLIPLSDTVTKLHAKCRYCGEKASFTLRTIDNDNDILVGGADLYVSACRFHYNLKFSRIS